VNLAADPTADLEAQALRWLVRLDGQSTPELLEQHNAWMAQSPRHRVMYAKQALAWRKMDALRRLRPLDPRQVDPDLLAKPTRRFAGSWVSRVLTSLIVVGLVALTTVGLGSAGGAEFSTKVGELSHVTLKDGTEAYLNTNTHLRIRFTEERRDVFLDRGEALFVVAHDADRPFDVTARGVTSRAVGTKFSVRLHDDAKVETVVAEGRVLVMRQSQLVGVSMRPRPIGRTLGAGEHIIVGTRTSTFAKLDARDIEQRLRWTTGKITFEGQPLGDVVRELNRYTERPLVIRDRKVAHTAVGGGFDVQSADEYAEELVKFFGGNVLAQADAVPARP
jgi:transmembrane sensor